MILENIHYLEGDFRIEGLEYIFDGFNRSLDFFVNKIKENNWYDAGFYREETELIYGIAFVSLQNYINRSCTDLKETEIFENYKSYDFYDNNSKIVKNGVTQVRLIIELANYFKHREDKNELFKTTKRVLDCVELYVSPERIENRFQDQIILDGLNLLTNSNDELSELLAIVKKWRDDTWKITHIK